MPETQSAHPYAALFAGRWIGQTQGSASPAHVWEISLARRGRLKIVTRWENDVRVGAPMTAELVPDEAAFVLRGPDRVFKAVLVDPQHFIVPGWDTNDMRGFAGPDYDVVFSRPGLAELTARRVWEAYRAGQGWAGADGDPPPA